MKNEIELITKALKDAYKFVKEQEQTKETSELLINLFKAEILVKNCSMPSVVGRSEQLSCGRNITTCVFYKDSGKCSNPEYCRDQTT